MFSVQKTVESACIPKAAEKTLAAFRVGRERIRRDSASLRHLALSRDDDRFALSTLRTLMPTILREDHMLLPSSVSAQRRCFPIDPADKQGSCRPYKKPLHLVFDPRPVRRDRVTCSTDSRSLKGQTFSGLGAQWLALATQPEPAVLRLHCTIVPVREISQMQRP